MYGSKLKIRVIAMSWWKKYHEFVDKIERLCAEPNGFEKKFEAEPWDRGGMLVVKGKEYIPASFDGDEHRLDEFVSCVVDVTQDFGRDIIVRTTKAFRKRGEVGVFVYFEGGIAGEYPEFVDLEEVEEYLEERGLI